MNSSGNFAVYYAVVAGQILAVYSYVILEVGLFLIKKFGLALTPKIAHPSQTYIVLLL